MLQSLGSPRLTLILLGVFAIGILSVYQSPGGHDRWVGVPLALLALNLLAAILSQPKFRRQVELLVFHVALLALVLLVALGRLMYLKGTLELAEGQEFAGTLSSYEAGPWHPWGLEGVSFVNEGFSIDYRPGISRGRTENRVRYRDGEGRWRVVAIGDQNPLALGGYRFYTSFNKGFAPTFLWLPRDGEPQRGAVHLPSYPIHEYEQANTWTPPGSGEEIWIQLHFDELILDPDRPSQFRVPTEHELVIRVGGERRAVVPGMRIELPSGTLVYEGVLTWMGYNVRYDWTLPWLLAACLVAVLSLGWHFWRRFSARPWLGAGEAAEAR